MGLHNALWKERTAYFCNECAKEHEYGEDMSLPVVNSPRCGVCRYKGLLGHKNSKNDRNLYSGEH